MDPLLHEWAHPFRRDVPHNPIPSQGLPYEYHVWLTSGVTLQHMSSGGQTLQAEQCLTAGLVVHFWDGDLQKEREGWFNLKMSTSSFRLQALLCASLSELHSVRVQTLRKYFSCVKCTYQLSNISTNFKKLFSWFMWAILANLKIWKRDHKKL